MEVMKKIKNISLRMQAQVQSSKKILKQVGAIVKNCAKQHINPIEALRATMTIARRVFKVSIKGPKGARQ